MEEDIVGTADLARVMREEYGIDKQQYGWQRLARLDRIPSSRVAGVYVFRRADLNRIARLHGWKGNVT